MLAESALPRVHAKLTVRRGAQTLSINATVQERK
jgi:hypothetical protein